MRVLLAVLTVVGLPIVAGAQTLEPVEISPFAGYFFGGTVFDYRNPGIPNLSFKNDVTYGVRVGWNLTSRIEPELQWSRTTPELSHGTPEELPTVKIDYFLGGASYNFANPVTRPYVSLDLGAGRFDALDFIP